MTRKEPRPSPLRKTPVLPLPLVFRNPLRKRAQQSLRRERSGSVTGLRHQQRTGPPMRPLIRPTKSRRLKNPPRLKSRLRLMNHPRVGNPLRPRMEHPVPLLRRRIPQLPPRTARRSLVGPGRE